MVEIDPGLDTRLRAFFDHYESEAMPPRLTTFDEDANPKRRIGMQFLAGAVGVAVIVAAAAVFGIELSSHRAARPPAPAVSPSSIARNLPPASQLTGLLPAVGRTVVPITDGRGSASLPTFIPTGMIFVEFSCSGTGSFAFRSTGGEVGSGSPMCYPRGAASGVLGTIVPASPAIDGKPLSLRITAGPGITWEIVVADSGSVTLPALGRPTLPANARVIVPATFGTGTSQVFSFDTSQQLFVQYSCTGSGTISFRSSYGDQSIASPGACANGAIGSERLNAQTLVPPVNLLVETAPKTLWEIVIYEAAKPNS
jgi:hypothetical protein